MCYTLLPTSDSISTCSMHSVPKEEFLCNFQNIQENKFALLKYRWSFEESIFMQRLCNISILKDYLFSIPVTVQFTFIIHKTNFDHLMRMEICKHFPRIYDSHDIISCISLQCALQIEAKNSRRMNEI